MIAADPRCARLAVATFFLVNGALFGSWVSRIPAVRTELGLSDATLGVVLLGLALGALVGLPLAGFAVARMGSRAVILVSTAAYCAALPLLGLAPTPIALAIALALFGVVASGLDVAMNAQGAMVEAMYARSIMSSLHAFFNLGGFAGAATGAIAASIRAAPFSQFAVASAVLFLIGAVAWLGLLPDPGGHRAKAVFVRPTRGLGILAAVSFCVLLAEGAMADWSALFVRSEIGSSPGRAALGFAAFSLAMTVGRLTGDSFTNRFGHAAVVRWGAAIATTGLVAALTASSVLVAILAFALTGLGLAATFPLAISAAAAHKGVPSTNIAAVSTAGYGGFMVGPPLIGFVAEATDLRWGLGAVALLTLTAVVLARSAPRAFAPSRPVVGMGRAGLEGVAR
jgi:MFS family permease